MQKDNMQKLGITASILARGYFASTHAKTAHGLIRHGTRFKIIEVIDEKLAGKNVSEIFGLKNANIPIRNKITTEADNLIIGIAPPGGKLPKKYYHDIEYAITHNMNIISGMHEFISDIPKYSKLADKYNVKIWDVRKPPKNLSLAKGYKAKVPVVLFSGTDSCIGKRTTLLEVLKSIKLKGTDAGYVATGQTGILIGCDAGMCIDALPSDFVSGAMELLIAQTEKLGRKIIFVEGQGSLLHPAYGQVAYGILIGTRPDWCIMTHDPTRIYRNSYPEKMPSLQKEKYFTEKLVGTKVIGISLNTYALKTEIKKCIQEYEHKYKIPTTDVIKCGAEKLVDAILNSEKLWLK